MKTYYKYSNPSKTANSIIFICVIVVTLLLGLGSYSNYTLFKSMDSFFYDQFMKYSASPKGSDKITIIDIDEISLSAVGQWPWPRYRLARIVETVHNMQPRAIGLDIVMPEIDRTSLKNIQERFQKDFALNLDFSGAPQSLSDNDGYLAHIFNKSSIVGSKYFYFDHFNKEDINTYRPFKITDSSGLLTLHKATGVLQNTSKIENSLKFTGFTNNQFDGDGIIRQTPLLIEFQGDIFTHLSLSTFLKAHEIKQAEILKDFYGLYIKAGNYKIPVTKKGYIQVKFNGPAMGYQYISAVDILNNTFAPSDIRNRIIFIGSSAIGLKDIHHTIFDTQFPGVEIQAVILDNIYNNQVIISPIWAKNLIMWICVATGIIMAFLLSNPSRPIALFVGTLALICVLFLSSATIYMKLSVFISPGLPILIVVFHFSFFSYIRFAIARRNAFVWFKKLASSQQLTMEALVSLVETRDPETGQHIQRTQHYAGAIAHYLRSNGHFSNILTSRYVATLFLSVALHDIGKVGIPDKILLKPGKLTDDEFEIMKRHSIIGRDTITRAASKILGDNYLRMGAEIAGSHHERWDGKGYPAGLSKKQIPLSGRIMAISDVYDALISRRCYKPPFSHEKSMEIIREGRETLFDPVIVDAFIEIESKIVKIASKFNDNIEETPVS